MHAPVVLFVCQFIAGFGEKICWTNLLAGRGRNDRADLILDLYVCVWLQEPMFPNPSTNSHGASATCDDYSYVCTATATRRVRPTATAASHGIQRSCAKHVP